MKNNLKNIRKAKVFDEPFDHIYVNEVFSDETYNRIISSLPKTEQYDYMAGSLRGSFEFDSWECKDLFLLSELKDVLCEKFKCIGKNECAVLIRDLNGFSIAPHPDSENKSVTALFYLPKDDSISDSGTEFYSGNGDLVKKFNFNANSMLAFKVGKNSYHGLRRFEKQTPRDLLLYYVCK